MRAVVKLLAAAALALLVSAPPVLAAEEFDKYAIESAAVSLSSAQAGVHADMTISFELSEKGGQPYAITRDVTIELPPGAIGNPQAVPTCSVAELGNDLFESHCPFSSQVGFVAIRAGEPLNGSFVEPIYNMEPPNSGDIIARFGFIAAKWPAFVNVRVDPSDYSVVATAEGVPSSAALISSETTIWAVPADPVHDADRLTPEEAFAGEKPPGGRPAGIPEAPFLSNPTDCSLQRQLTITATSYQLPQAPSTMSVPYPQIGGCGKLDFDPIFSLLPTNPEAFAPSGVDSQLTVPQDENPKSRATSTIKGASVTLPQGFAINPAAADGQEACSSEQVGFGENTPAACPNGAKIGSVEVDVPALEDVLHGSLYLRTPEPGRLFRFWLVTDEQGVRLKLPAEVELNPLTGQLTTVFSGIPSLGGLPQVPFENLEVQVPGGPRAALATPGCGTYQTSFRFVPWSGNAAVEGQTPMQITVGCGKGGFDPGLVAGTLSTAGGSYSPFTMTLTRSDGEANPGSLTVQLPQGLLAKIRGVALCPEAAAASGQCPAESRIGALTAAAGVGGAPLWIPQPGKAPTAVYLAGAYKGAPYSVVSAVPAQAGPFDLGTVVNRAAVQIDPNTAKARVQTDPLPQILEGVPIAYRAINVVADRANFFLNPTDCSRKQIRVTLTATDGQVAEPTAPFQASDCAKLRYRPKLKLAFRGATKRTGHPAARAVLTQKPNQANMQSTTVILPSSQFIDNAHINNPCTRVQFDANACPKGSILGTVEARTPLLAEPLRGKIYFRSNGGARLLPDIVVDVRGAGIRIIQVGFIDSIRRKGSERSRIRTRFLSLPDAPLSRVELNFFGGKRGLLVNSRDLCAHTPRATVILEAQNGRARRADTVIDIPC